VHDLNTHVSTHGFTDDQEGKTKAGADKGARTSSKLAGKGAAAASKKSTTPPLGRMAAFSKKAHKLLFGWLDPRYVLAPKPDCEPAQFHSTGALALRQRLST
jgi:hypothetical protein